MPKAIAVAAPLQAVSSRNFAPTPLDSRFPRRWDKSHRWVRRLLHPTVTETYMVLVEAGRRRICIRHLAHLRRVSERTIRYHLAAMEKARVVRVVRTRIGPRRNAPNIFIFLDVDGTALVSTYPATECREKRVQRFNTTTPPLAAESLPVKPEARTGRPAYSRRAENHPPAFRHAWQQRQRWLAIAEHKARERCRLAMRASVGAAWTFPPLPPPTAEELAQVAFDQAEMEAREQRNRERKAVEAAMKAEMERQREEAQRVRTAACDRCKGSGRAMADHAGRPVERDCWECIRR
jgi:hypothetical protein